jgi:hypothetical protein
MLQFSFMNGLTVQVGFIRRPHILDDPCAVFGGVKNRMLAGDRFVRQKNLAAHLPAHINRPSVELQFINTALAKTYKQTHSKVSRKCAVFLHHLLYAPPFHLSKELFEIFDKTGPFTG